MPINHAPSIFLLYFSLFFLVFLQIVFWHNNTHVHRHTHKCKHMHAMGMHTQTRQLQLLLYSVNSQHLDTWVQLEISTGVWTGRVQLANEGGHFEIPSGCMKHGKVGIRSQVIVGWMGAMLVKFLTQGNNKKRTSQVTNLKPFNNH